MKQVQVIVRLLDGENSYPLATAYLEDQGGTVLHSYNARFLVKGKLTDEARIRAVRADLPVWDLVQRALNSRILFDADMADAEDGFWSKVDRREEHWFFKGTDNNGLRWDGRRQRPAPIAFQIVYGLYPEGTRLQQRCGVKGCIRPQHHYILGTTPTAEGEPEVAVYLCPRGHEIPRLPKRGQNLYCPTCARERAAARSKPLAEVLEVIS